MMNFSETSNQSDLQNHLFKSNPVRIGISAFAVILVFFVLISLYSIIWYERYGCDLRRTLGNRLLSLMCWIWIEMFLVTFAFEIVMFSYGHLPSKICAFYIFMKNVYAIQAILMMDGIIIARCILIFYIKSPGTFQDDFWCRFIFLFVKFSAYLAQFVSETLPARHSINYLVCIGAVEEEDVDKPRRNRVLVSIAIASGIIHCIILLKIWSVKFKMDKRKMTQVQDTILVNCIGNRRIFPMLENSITSLPTSICNFMAILVYAAALRKINVMKIEDVYKYPNYWFIVTFYLLGVILVCIVISVNYFITNRELRNAIFREVRQINWWPQTTIKKSKTKVSNKPIIDDGKVKKVTKF